MLKAWSTLGAWSVFCSLGFGQAAAPVAVNCLPMMADGTNTVNGTVMISWPSFVSNGDTEHPVQAGENHYAISNSSISPAISLIPTDTATQLEPNLLPVYTVTIENGAKKVVESWQVPTPVSPATSVDCGAVVVTSITGQTYVGPVISQAEVPSGAVNGTNTVFTLSYAPSPAASVQLYLNGLLMSAGIDYTLSGSTITFINGVVPQTGDILAASYQVGFAPVTPPICAANTVAAGPATGSGSMQPSCRALVTADLPAGVSAVWGSISGTLANQTDLQTALNALQPTSAKDAARGYAGLDSSGLLNTSEFPGSIPSNAATATAFAATPVPCSAGEAPLGVDASGNAIGCEPVGGGSGGGSGGPSGTYSQGATPATNNVACASSVSFDAIKGPVQAITLTCSVTSVSIINLWAGATLKFHICEGSGGGYTWPAWPGVFHGAFVPGTTASTCSDQVFESPDGTNLYAQSIGVINQ